MLCRTLGSLGGTLNTTLFGTQSRNLVGSRVKIRSPIVKLTKIKGMCRQRYNETGGREYLVTIRCVSKVLC